MIFRKTVIATQVALLFSPFYATFAHGQEREATLGTVTVTAEEQLKQSLGASTVSGEDIEEQGVTNDLSEIIRKQPGVNLTGNSTSGQRGNNRQIDIRGMGPENTLIMIDGKPVRSRTSVRYSRRGERDTRGDSNWVPAELVDSIEVLRGPSAAHYGDGAAGGVVNIITKKNFDKLSGSINTYYSNPYHAEEGDTRRASFNLMAPLGEKFGLRLYGNVNKTNADKWYINLLHNRNADGSLPSTFTAGREGVRNRDANAMLRWSMLEGHTVDFEVSGSQQRNIYAGDTQLSTGSATGLENNNSRLTNVSDLIGSNTNTMTRTAYSATYKGHWGEVSNTSYVQYEQTRNDRYDEGLNGQAEGIFTTDRERITSKLRNLDLKSETMIIFHQPVMHTLTAGLAYNHAQLHDTNFSKASSINTADTGGRSPDYSTQLLSLTLEDNIMAAKGLTVTPGLYLEHHSKVGNSINPSLNAWYGLTDRVTLKAGVARAYKSPNIYQLDPNYRQYSQGFGCWNNVGTACYIQGNENLTAERSVNSEIGLEYDDGTIMGNLTFFNNDYRDKVDAGINPIGTENGLNVYQYYNVPKAIVRGFESTFNVHLGKRVDWNNNLTYMVKSLNKDTGEALSIIPKFTLNTTLSWTVTRKLTANLMGTLYGKQRSRTLDSAGNAYVGNALGKYALWSLSGNYQFNKHVKLRGGVNNIFDRQLWRTGDGAETYNEPGRAFWVGLNVTF